MPSAISIHQSKFATQAFFLGFSAHLPDAMSFDVVYTTCTGQAHGCTQYKTIVYLVPRPIIFFPVSISVCLSVSLCLCLSVSLCLSLSLSFYVQNISLPLCLSYYFTLTPLYNNILFVFHSFSLSPSCILITSFSSSAFLSPSVCLLLTIKSRFLESRVRKKNTSKTRSLIPVSR